MRRFTFKNLVLPTYITLLFLFFLVKYGFFYQGANVIPLFDAITVYLNYLFAFVTIGIVFFFTIKLLAKNYIKIKKNIKEHFWFVLILLILFLSNFMLFMKIPLEFSYGADTPYYEFLTQAAYLDKFNINDNFHQFYGPHGFVNGFFIHWTNIFFNDYFVSAKITSILFYGLSIIALYFLIYLVSKNRFIAVFGSYLFLSNLFILLNSINSGMEMICVFFTILFFISFLLYDKLKTGESRALLFLIFVLLVQFRTSNFVLIIPVGLYIIMKRQLRSFISKNRYFLVLSVILLIPFLLFSLFASSNLYHAMDGYNHNNLAQDIGWDWWDGVFSFKYFNIIFPKVINMFFDWSSPLGIISQISIFLFIFSFMPLEKKKKILVFLWFLLPTIVFSAHFMNMASNNFTLRYYPHIIVPFIVLLCIFLKHAMIYFKTGVRYYLENTAKHGKYLRLIRPTKKIIFAILLILLFLHFVLVQPLTYQKLHQFGVFDKDFKFFREVVSSTVSQDCVLIGADFNARVYLPYLNGYEFVQAYTFLRKDLEFYVGHDRCKKFICYSGIGYLISDNECESYVEEGDRW